MDTKRTRLDTANRNMRRTHRPDGNQSRVVKMLRSVGAQVFHIGRPVDLLVAYQGRTFLFELKDANASATDRKLRPEQQRFFDEWKGGPLAKVETLADAFTVMGIEIQ